MAERFNPPPNWPPAPEGWTPPPGWRPDPAWGPPPQGWQLYEGEPQRPKTKSRRKVWLSVAAVVLLIIFIGSLGDDEDSASTAASSTASESLSPEDTAAAEAAAAALMDPGSYETISDRDYLLIAKDPDAHAGRKLVLYGYVTQFDSATGPDAFLASAGGERHDEWYEYDQNTAVAAPDPGILGPVVEGDIVRMFVVVTDSFSYDTQIGGNTTVPRANVNMIEVIGST